MWSLPWNKLKTRLAKMSRFGIRKRLKKIMDGGPTEVVCHTVTYVLPDETVQVVSAEEGYNLLMASQTLPAPIGTGRRAGGPCPDGRCGLCRVEILDDTGISSMTSREQDTLDAHVRGDAHEGSAREPGPPANERTRLACYCRIQASGGRVKVLELFDYTSITGDPEGT
jgi:ferredoxin